MMLSKKNATQVSICIILFVVVFCSPVFASQQLPPDVVVACEAMLKTPGPAVDTCLCSFSTEGHGISRDGLTDRSYLSKDARYFCNVMLWDPQLGEQSYLEQLSAVMKQRYIVAISPATSQKTGDTESVDRVQESVQGDNVLAKSQTPNDSQSTESQLHSIQSALTECGFDPGPIDGVWGAKTRIAANAYLEAHGVSAKSNVPLLISQIDSFGKRCPATKQVAESNGKANDTSENKGREWDSGAIKVAQWGLERCGYKVDINGVHDAKMKSAMRQYLVDSGKPNKDLSLSKFNLEQRGCPEGRSASSKSSSLAGQNLAGSNLSNMNLSTANLTNTNLSNTNLTNVRLSRANLTNTNLANSNLTNTNFTRANLTDANLSGIVANGANFKDAILDRANLKNSDMRKSVMNGASLIGAVVAGMRFSLKTKLSVSALASAATAVPATLAGSAAKWIQDKALKDLETGFNKVIAIGKDNNDGYVVIGD